MFTAAALLVVVATALLVNAAGLSMALGAFIAGVLLADSEYRHELEADLEPFKGLLLGLFFIAVGMSVNLGLLAREPLTLLRVTCRAHAVKVAVVLRARTGSRRSSATGAGASPSRCRRAASSPSCCSPRGAPAPARCQDRATCWCWR